MSNLTGSEIKDSYKDLLHMGNSNTGVTDELEAVYDGEGTQSALELSSKVVKASGPQSINESAFDLSTISTKSVLQVKGAVDSTNAIHMGLSSDECSYIQTADSASSQNISINPFGGDVGIGTRSPSNSKLHVANGHLNLDESKALAWGGGDNRPAVIGSKSNNTLKFYAESSPVLTIEKDKVLFDKSLDIKSTAGIFATHIHDSAGQSLGGFYESDNTGMTGALSLYLKDADETKVRLSASSEISTYFNSGAVGIGTTTPEGKLEIYGNDDWASPDLHLKGVSPTIKLNDIHATDDWYIHVNENNFFLLVDRGANGTDDPIDDASNAWETPHPLKLEGDTNKGYLFDEQLVTQNNFSFDSSTQTLTINF